MIKKITFYFICISTVLVLSNCDSFANFNPSELNSVNPDETVENNDDGNGGGNNDGNGGGTTAVVVDDPEISSCECQRIDVSTDATLIEGVEIPDELPENYDLSELMPPVRSQGNQGSCVSWAISYYLKSYQEKVQYGYEYEAFEHVMSPAYIYNQVKEEGDCLKGSEIRKTLNKLRDEGVVTWEDFPYFDSVCDQLPSSTLLDAALDNRIEGYAALGVPLDNTDENYTLINLIKTLLSEDNPIIVSMEFTELLFHYQNDKYIAYGFEEDANSQGSSNCHAILIVGYDDAIGGFKFVNSWGTNWGNEGYGWLTYDYFRPEDDILHIKGYSESYIAYDLE